MKKNLAIILEFGFHDVKKFIHSGLAVELSKNHNIIWFSLNKKNDLFQNYFNGIGDKIVYISNDKIICKESLIESYNQSIRRNWMVKNEFGLFHNYQKVRTQSIKTTLFGSSKLKWVFEKLTLNKYINYYNDEIAHLFVEHKIQSVLFISFSSFFIRNVIATSVKLNLSTFCIVNSWKDLYINNFIPFKKLTKLFVWDDQMKKDYLKHMPYLRSEIIEVVGNPTFDYLIDSAPKYTKAYYAEKYDLNIDSKWIYYTMMPPGVINDEIETVQFVAKSLYNKFGNEYTLLLRLNPNHNPTEFKYINLPPNTRLTQHYCIFNRVEDMLVQSKEGEQEWLDLLHHTIANFSVPSTVTKECLILGKTVFNIAFDKNDLVDYRITQFFEAGYYKNLFDSRSVYRINNIEMLFKNLDKKTNLPKKVFTSMSSTLIAEYINVL